MKIAYIGNFGPEHSTENDVRKSVEALGHEVLQLQEDATDFRAVPAVVAAADCDFLLWTRTWALDQEAQRAMLEECNRRGIVTVAMHLDRYWGLVREHQIHDEPWWRCNYVFTADGGNEERFADAGVNHHWLPPAVLADSCYRGNYRPDLAYEIVFVGSVNYHSEWAWRREMVSQLTRRYRRRFQHLPRGRRAVRGRLLNDVYASAKVVVGDSCLAGGATHYWSDRIPETLGRGGFLIHPEVVGLDTQYTAGEHLLTYPCGDFNALTATIDAALRDPEMRERISTAGMEHVRQHHTYRHRVEQMLEVLMTDHRVGGWRGEIRDGTSDPLIYDEIYREDVYRARDVIGPGSVVVDVGANVGFFSVWAAQHGAEVIAVEPNPTNLEQFDSNVRAHGDLGDRITLHRKAIGSRSGEYVEVHGDGGGAWTSRADSGVATLSLDDVIPEAGCDLLKLDVEGAEFSAVEGATLAALRRCRHIVVEFHNEPMLDREVPEGSFGRMVEKMGEVFQLDIIGRPSTGGYIYGRCL